MFAGPSNSNQISQSEAKQLLEAVDAFFSDIAYATNGTLLSFHEGAGIMPTQRSTEIAFNTWGNHTHGIGEGNMKLPAGLTWQNLKDAGLTDIRNGLLRVDLVREAAGVTANTA